MINAVMGLMDLEASGNIYCDRMTNPSIAASVVESVSNTETLTELQKAAKAAVAVNCHLSGIHSINEKVSSNSTTTSSSGSKSKSSSPIISRTLHNKKPTGPISASTLQKKLAKEKDSNIENCNAAVHSLENRVEITKDARPKLTEKEQNLSKQIQLLPNRQQQRCTEALAVLLHYLVFDLDALNCPSTKRENKQIKEKLHKTLLLLDETKSTCADLQDKLRDKETYYTERENELQSLHCCELDKVRGDLSEFKNLARQQLSELENDFRLKDAENKRNMDCYRLEMENKLAEKQHQLQVADEQEKTLLQRLKALEQSEQELHEKITSVENSYANRFHVAMEREQELNQRIKTLNRELDNMRLKKENSERLLKDKLDLSQDEIAVLRNSQRALNDSVMSQCQSPRNTSISSQIGSSEISLLQSEADSLRCVLELKQKEISKLIKQNEELLRDAEEKSALQNKISLLDSKNEMLQSEVDIKSDREKDLLRQIDSIQKALNHETVKRTRLLYDNEALQWQLKQRSEQLHIVEAKLTEFSSLNNSSNNLVQNSFSMNGSAILSSTHMEDISQPASPVIKGVIEKTDSVSWVLEMDDETPEVAASKMVRRAGSFKCTDRGTAVRRHLSASTGANFLNVTSSQTSVPHPLSQSMSATSVVRQHSATECINRSHSRYRSKSVSVKGSDNLKNCFRKEQQRLCVPPTGVELTASDLLYEETLENGSSFALRPRSSTLKVSSAKKKKDDLHNHTSIGNKLITCDTAALNSREPLKVSSLPSLPSVHDLKAMKKCQQIQELAGEAMVSGTNSEDESCSASDDAISSASNYSAGTDSASYNIIKNPRISYEDVLLNKISSVPGTPMEMSWSEDVDALGADSSSL